jgi:uncharacterized protein YifE (UPF0438 family)
LERHNVGRRGATIRYSARGLEAFFECDVSHYPRFLADNGKETKVDENEIVTRIAAELNKLTESKSNPLGDNLTRARESLNEVKALTEYEDQKATREGTLRRHRRFATNPRIVWHGVQLRLV